MTLQITIAYFNGAGRDSFQYRNMTAEEATTYKEQFLKGMQRSLESGQILCVNGYGEDTGQTLAYGPGLLRYAHIKFDLVDE